MNHTIISATAVVAAVAASGAYLRWAVKPVHVAFRFGQAAADIDYRKDVRVLGHGLADAVTMLRESGAWEPGGEKAHAGEDAPQA